MKIPSPFYEVANLVLLQRNASIERSKREPGYYHSLNCIDPHTTRIYLRNLAAMARHCNAGNEAFYIESIASQLVHGEKSAGLPPLTEGINYENLAYRIVGGTAG
ncbi:hypothetical protein [Serratia marcescens]|uniref:hypothetical protein n=1 Tax=Serratia marcescens TaxID=615 RepID=UPI003D03B286